MTAEESKEVAERLHEISVSLQAAQEKLNDFIELLKVHASTKKK